MNNVQTFPHATNNTKQYSNSKQSTFHFLKYQTQFMK